jgi:predicted acyltransferase
VLFAAGWSVLFLAVLYWIIDVRGWKSWAFFFTVIGMNSITIYVASDLFDFRGIANVFIHGFAGELGAFTPSFTALSVLAVKWLLLWFLYRQKIFLRV